jgi:hypothetical protein
MTEAIVRHNEEGKFELVYNGQVLAKSKHRDYFEYHIGRRDIPELNALNITNITYTDNSVAISTPSGADVASLVPEVQTPMFTINERFDMMDQLIEMTVSGSTSAMLIGGRGGIGKSFAVQQVLARMGKTNVDEALAGFNMAATKITDEDDEDTISEKVELLAKMDSMGDYKIVKGYSTPKALYRLLYENKKRVLIFDDCDAVLRDPNAINILKSALDTYEERWVSWNTEAPYSDLPQCFRFQGQVIFITNMDMAKIDEAVRTRCFKADLSITKEQRVERMEAVLENVMPNVEIELKRDALQLLRDNLDVAIDVSFRALMNLIKIRIDPAVKDWQKLGQFTLLQN